jgi:hypothetical protein
MEVNFLKKIKKMSESKEHDGIDIPEGYYQEYQDRKTENLVEFIDQYAKDNILSKTEPAPHWTAEVDLDVSFKTFETIEEIVCQLYDGDDEEGEYDDVYVVHKTCPRILVEPFARQFRIFSTAELLSACLKK